MKEVIIEIIEEILDREITLDSIEILTLEIEVMVRMTGIVPSVIILISQEEPSVIDAVNHVQEDQEEILEVAVTVDVGILEEAEIESVEILEEETMEIVGKEMEEILERHLLIMTGIVLNAIIQIFRSEPSVIDAVNHVQEGPEEILETVEIVGVETMEEAVDANAEIVEEEIMIEIEEMVTEGFPIEMRSD